jgi:hypothetical protein
MSEIHTHTYIYTHTQVQLSFFFFQILSFYYVINNLTSSTDPETTSTKMYGLGHGSPNPTHPTLSISTSFSMVPKFQQKLPPFPSLSNHNSTAESTIKQQET